MHFVYTASTSVAPRRAANNCCRVRRFASTSKTWQGRKRSWVDVRPTVTAVEGSKLDLPTFRHRAFRPKRPLAVRGNDMPAIGRWFQPDAAGRPGWTAPTPYFEQFGWSVQPAYELICPAQSEGAVHAFHAWLSASDEQAHQALAAILSPLIQGQPNDKPASDDHALGLFSNERFIQFHAPLALFLAAMRFNQTAPTPLTQLYIAQTPLADLAPELNADVPLPNLVRLAGRGDLYASSIWLGLVPTHTPLHQDPNPNMFYQLCGSKLVRLLPPEPGLELFHSVQRRMGTQRPPALRGQEMMQAPERLTFYDAVWGPLAPPRLREVLLRPGDALFIPKGWWHSVKTRGRDGTLNASVNWWFR